DFSEVKSVIRNFVERLDHQFLNDLKPFDELNPSAENLAKYVHDGLGKQLGNGDIRLQAVTVWETDTSSATYRP
ncbi:MAG TPA: 6-carboxytetrahydropterin synthase, partial [Terriglobia bacterium]|nr:6-carboxytetrahydropterin synthase [Terriglobia bacterium]